MKPLALAAMVLVAGAAVGIGAWGILRPPPGPSPEKSFPSPDFTVTTHDGATLHRNDLRGRPWLAAFVFTRCTSVCPIVTSRLSGFARTLPPAYRIVAFSIDPDHDTRDVLAKHAAGLGADGKRWAFTRFESKAERDRVVQKGFFMGLEDTPADTANPIAHAPYIALIDANGVVRAWYDSTDADKMEELRRDATALGLTGFYAMPAVNATLNALSAILLLTGISFIRAGRRDWHVAYVLGALLASAAFLVCYLWYHAVAGSTRFPGTGTARTLYLALLLTHTILAAAVPPLVCVVVWKAAKKDWERHKKWARITVPAWLYVSVTGVSIYWWLFRT